MPSSVAKQKGSSRARRACSRDALASQGSTATLPASQTSVHTSPTHLARMMARAVSTGSRLGYLGGWGLALSSTHSGEMHAHHETTLQVTPGGMPRRVPSCSDLLGSSGCQHMYCSMLCSSSVRLNPAVGIAEVGVQDLPAVGLVEKR